MNRCSKVAKLHNLRTMVTQTSQYKTEARQEKEADAFLARIAGSKKPNRALRAAARATNVGHQLFARSR